MAYKPRERKIYTPTPDYLAKAAFAYLARYAASEAGLRRVLTNRVRKAALRNPEFAADHEAQGNLRDAIEKIVAKHKASGVINDKNYAEVKARSLRLSGKSQRRISDVLMSKGLDTDDIQNAILKANEGEDGAEVELAAARRLAKRRRLGVYRTRALPANQDARDVERRDLASLARAGFSLDVARRALREVL